MYMIYNRKSKDLVCLRPDFGLRCWKKCICGDFVEKIRKVFQKAGICPFL